MGTSETRENLSPRTWQTYNPWLNSVATLEDMLRDQWSGATIMTAAITTGSKIDIHKGMAQGMEMAAQNVKTLKSQVSGRSSENRTRVGCRYPQGCQFRVFIEVTSKQNVDSKTQFATNAGRGPDT